MHENVAFSKTLFKPEEFDNDGFSFSSFSFLCIFVWTENSLKKKLFETDSAMLITWFPCPRFSQIQI